MAPMITDSYLKYNDTDFSNSNSNGKYYNTSNKPPLPSLSYSMNDQQKYGSINDANFNFGFRRAYSEDAIIEILRGNSYKQQFDLFEDLLVQTKSDSLDIQVLNIKNLDEFYNSIGILLTSTISNEVQRNCLRFLQSYFKLADKLKQRRKSDVKLNEKFKQIDSKISNVFLNHLIQTSVSQKLQLKQISIDLIYSYMKLTDDLNEKCFSKFIKYGIENSDSVTAKQFMDPTLCILLTEDFQEFDFFPLIKSLTKQLSIEMYEKSALKCINKIENILPKDKFVNLINKLPLNNRNTYLNMKNNNRNSIQFKTNPLTDRNDLDDNMKFNLIPSRILQKLSGEDELQRLQAINQMETIVKNLRDVKTVYPYYQDFIVFMSNFVDDTNYEIRLGSIKTLSIFIEKLGNLVHQCYKAICSCARNVMSQTHQSKTIRQSLTSMIIITVDNMSTPVLVLESLLEKIKDRSAKTREETLNLVIACLLRFPSDKFESLRKVFFLVSPLLCDIKRNVRHACLECLAVILNRLKQIDRNAGNIIEQLEHVPDFQNFENLNIIKDVIVYRLNRNKIATLNSDMTVEYGMKLPSAGSTISSNGLDLDVEWIISASSSSASASNLSSARSQRSVFIDSTSNMGNATNQNSHRITNLKQPNIQISTGSFRRPSGTRRLPWEELQNNSSSNVPNMARSREVAPLKAFPLNDELELLHVSNNKTAYPSTTSYQEKYLKKLQDQKIHQSKTDSQLDLSDISTTAIKIQNDKAHSLDNLYNLDDNINSENNVQKRKYANLNLKNGIIPSKPIIPRRNSANRYRIDTTNDLNTSTNNSYTNRSNYESEIDTNSQFSGDTGDGGENKFDTVPSIRHSAKNRRKLDKIFSIGSNTAPPNSNTNLFDSKNFKSNPNLSTVNTNRKPKEENLYLNKLKAEKNQNEMNTSSYSPSNPESGIFSISDYDQTENRFIKLQKSYNSTEPKKIMNNTKDTTNKQNYDSNLSNGVSFKQTHSSDVEIVGVKLGNQSNQDQNNNQNFINKKKNSLKNENANNENDGSNSIGNNNDNLDIVGRGYYSNYESNNGQDNNDKNDNQSNPEEFPLSLSFRSRLKQKTMEKIEEKNKQKIKANQKKELENLNNTITAQSPQLYHQNSNDDGFKNDKNFGLSISGYPSSKNTSNNQNYDYDDPNDKKINGKYSGYDLSNIEYPDEQFESNSSMLPSLDRPKFQPTKATQSRIKARQAAAAAVAAQTDETTQPNSFSNPQTPSNTRKRFDQPETDSEIVTRIVKEDFVKQPFKNPENAFKEAMNYLSQEDWENKCNAMNIIRRLSVYHEDIAVNNIHSIVLALVQEVKNLRSQVSRFALMTFGELFVNLKKFMDVDLDIAIKSILQKLSETNEFIRLDIEKCLDKMINNVTTTKAIIALINGGASHRNPLIRRVAAQYVYKCCEIMGPGRILSGIKDVTERILITAAQFVVDGPVDIRWYGRKIFHILMSHEEFDRLLVKYLNEKTRKNIKEILDTIRVKGPGDVPTESARNSRKTARISSDLITRSAGANHERSESLYGVTEAKPLASRPNYSQPPLPPSLRLDQQSQEYIKSICAQLRNPDFRERIDAIEKFQILCEQEPKLAVINLVQIFDKFNPCLTESNSKVNYKALNTMYLITPLLSDDLNPVMVNVIPLIAQNLASKNSEIQDMASNILDVLVEYLEGGSLIQPFANIAIHGNARVKPQIIFKLADLVARVYSRKQKQVELHILPAVWQLLGSVKGTTGSSGANSLNASISKLVLSLYEQMGDQLIERASNSSSVSSRNLEVLKNILSTQLD